MTQIEMKYMENMPQRLMGIEKELQEININLNDLCRSMGGLVRALQELDPKREEKLRERRKKWEEEATEYLKIDTK